MSKPGRNDPCYCGSGKKYKQCHLREDQAVERELRAQVDAARFLRLDLPGFAREERFAADFDRALPYYWNNYYDASNAGEMSEFEALRFLDWFVFDYGLGDGTRILEIYQNEVRNDLKSVEKKLLERWMDAPPAAAYELQGYDGQVLHLKFFLNGETIYVFEAGGRGNVEIGEIILARLVPVSDRLEFSTVAAFLSADEIDGLAEKLETAQESDSAAHPGATQEEFLRRNNQLLIHHALEQAEKVGRPPVARLDPDRTDTPIQQQHDHDHDRERVHRQRNYGSTKPHMAQTRRKAV
jgi:hypothetical protein